MSSPPPSPGDLGADDQDELPVAEQESGMPSKEGLESSGDEEMGTDSPTTSGEGQL